MHAKKREISRLSAGEIELLQMLWRAGAVTILEAQTALGLPIGYTTVQTRLNRLVKKGVAKKSKTRPAKYSAALTPDEVRQTDLDLLVDRVSQGQVVPLVAQLIDRKSITRDELLQVKQLLEKAEKQLALRRKKETN